MIGIPSCFKNHAKKTSEMKYGRKIFFLKYDRYRIKQKIMGNRCELISHYFYKTIEALCQRTGISGA